MIVIIRIPIIPTLLLLLLLVREMPFFFCFISDWFNLYGSDASNHYTYVCISNQQKLHIYYWIIYHRIHTFSTVIIIKSQNYAVTNWPMRRAAMDKSTTNLKAKSSMGKHSIRIHPQTTWKLFTNVEFDTREEYCRWICAHRLQSKYKDRFIGCRYTANTLSKP